MAKELVAYKIIIELEKNQFKSGILLYKESIDGTVGKDFKSISIKNMDFPKLHLVDIIEKVVSSTKEKEKCNV